MYTHGKTCPFMERTCQRMECAFYEEDKGCLIYLFLKSGVAGGLNLMKNSTDQNSDDEQSERKDHEWRIK